MNDPSPDMNLFEWAVGVLAAGVLAILGHLHLRVNRSEDKLGARMDRFEEQQAKLHSESREETREFRRQVFDRLDQMVTKQDLRDFWWGKGRES